METIKLIRYYWNQMPLAERVLGVGVVAFFPVLMLAIAVVLP